jgi:hypothetical protein
VDSETANRTITLAELGAGVPWPELAELLSKLPELPDVFDVEIVEHGMKVVGTFGPAIKMTVVDDGTWPFAKRVTVKGECRCGQVLGRYTGGLRLTATCRGGVPGIRLGDDGVFVTNCRRHVDKGIPSSGWQTCMVPPKRWHYDVLATELRKAWDEGRRRFVLT